VGTFLFLSGCTNTSVANLRGTSRFLVHPLKANASYYSFLDITSIVYTIENTPVLRHTVNYPSDKLNEKMQEVDYFKSDPKVMMMIDIDNNKKEERLGLLNYP
jgi:hypothetical protein